MKLPSFSLPEALSPLKGLSVPKINLADLTKVRRNWASVMPHVGGDAGPGVLQEVSDFGPNPGALRMLQYAPPGLPKGAPLVVVLHGCTQTGAGYDRGTGWSTLAARHGFALLYPEQQRSNNANLCFNWYETGDITRGQGEAASIRGMVARAVSSLGCDPARVFVTGLSAGAAMTAAMLATYPDVFAAGAIIAGLPYGSAHSMQEAIGAMYHAGSLPPVERGTVVRAASPLPQRKPIVSIWHGDADTTVVPANGAELAKQWCDVHGLGERDVAVDMVNGVPHRAWRDAGGTVRVELYTVPGMGHGTPIDTSAPGDMGVGVAMPHVLQTGISSTWHIARSWGLV